MNKSGGTGDCYRTPAYRQPNTTSGVSDIPEIVCQTNRRTARRLNGFFETAYRNPGESTSVLNGIFRGFGLSKDC
jgi:hypothetical protein